MKKRNDGFKCVYAGPPMRKSIEEKKTELEDAGKRPYPHNYAGDEPSVPVEDDPQQVFDRADMALNPKTGRYEPVMQAVYACPMPVFDVPRMERERNEIDNLPLQSELLFCRECGAENDALWKFCMNCGAKLQKPPMNCAVCGKSAPDGANFCPYCGNKLRLGGSPDNSGVKRRGFISRPTVEKHELI